MLNAIRKMKAENTRALHPYERPKSKLDYTRAGKEAEGQSPHAHCRGMRDRALTLGNSLAASQRVKYTSTTQPSVSTPRIHPKETKSLFVPKTHVRVFRRFTHNHSSVETSYTSAGEGTDTRPPQGLTLGKRKEQVTHTVT